MEKNFKISVIVTAYNEEKLIGPCLDSLLKQTWPNYEIVVIDDGSTDRSGDIINSYATQHCTIKALHQQNAGVTAARKAGVEASDGKYICFVDGDDTVKENYLYDFASQIKEHDEILLQDIGININSTDSYIRHLVSNCFPCGLCKKLFAKSILKNVFTTPRDINIGEDLITNLLIAQNASSIRMVKNDGYYVTDNINSVTHSRTWSLDYETKFTEYVEKTLGGKTSEYEVELYRLRLQAWKNLVAHGVHVPKSHQIPTWLQNHRKGRFSASEIILRFVPTDWLKRYLINRLIALRK